MRWLFILVYLSFCGCSTRLLLNQKDYDSFNKYALDERNVAIYFTDGDSTFAKLIRINNNYVYWTEMKNNLLMQDTLTNISRVVFKKGSTLNNAGVGLAALVGIPVILELRQLDIFSSTGQIIAIASLLGGLICIEMDTNDVVYRRE